MFAPSLQTHFDARIDLESLRQVRAFGFRWARIDAQKAEIWTMHEMIADAQTCDLTPLPIVYDFERLRQIPPGLDVEWGNEPDGDILPATYRTQLDEACRIALEYGLRLWAPAISNLDWDSLYWLQRIRAGGWPDGLAGVTVHRYGDGSFEYAHAPFDSRQAEVDELRTMLDGLPCMVTEFGYPTTPGTRGRIKQILGKDYAHAPVARGLTEDEQAACIAKEWEFWRAQDFVPFLYQINDGAPQSGEGYGIRRCAVDGTLLDWKPAAYQVPKEFTMPVINGTATFAISRSESFEIPDNPGVFATYHPKGQRETVVSVQKDGTLETRPVTQVGAWEKWREEPGDRAVFFEADGAYFALPLVK